MTHKPTAESRTKVARLYLGGSIQDEIAYYLGITPETLRKHYDRELRVPLMDCNERLANDLYESAKNGDKDDRRFWLTHRGNWYKTPIPDKKDEEIDNKQSVIEKLIDKIPTHER